MFRNATLAALALAASSAGFAAQASDQLATSLGVEPGQYTTAELAQIRSAVEKGDSTRVAFLLNGGSQDDGLSNGSQLAGSLGVAPGTYTTAELVRLRDALEDGRSQSQSYVLDGTYRVTRNATPAAAPSDSQLAQLLGVEAASYTNGELGAMYLGAHD
ncbi:hypothetical protein [Poseidonocella sp. HB161398]|uniref:hypothetical protein n=1 Tax=Poseidonocella sp. HB161398 TaxID=2320855 RepID=UPI001108B3C0|nr:hypothetical protein [Poseidonocella sp. HB161398]